MKKMTTKKTLSPAKRRCKLSQEQITELLKLASMGWSYSELAKHFCVSKNFIWYTVRGDKESREETEGVK